MNIRTIADLRAEYKRTDSGHWFDRRTLRFFGSTFPYRTVYGGRFFVEEQTKTGRCTVLEAVCWEDGTYTIETRADCYDKENARNVARMMAHAHAKG